jgi:hypothetical protein
MTKSSRLLMLMVIPVLTIFVTAVPAQEKKSKSPEEMLTELWLKVSAPGEHHAVFKEMEGDWNFHMKMWMDPSQPPMESDGTCKSEAMLGGRYLRSMELLGYDNFRGEYNMVWVDNLGTGITTAKGQPDSTGKIITFTGKMDEPTTGERDKNVRYVYRIDDPDHHVFEGWDLVGTPQEFKVMEITYTRN